MVRVLCHDLPFVAASLGMYSIWHAQVIYMLRVGVDIFSLQKLMGHADPQVLRRYLAQTTEDIAEAHRIGSPVDRCKL